MKGKHPQKKQTELLDKGGHGCVFKPPLPCKKSKAVAKTVGKVIPKDEAEIELEIASIIQGIPGYERYFIIQEEDTCSSTNFHELRPTIIKQCKVPEIKKARDKNLTQLISRYGGRTLLDTPISEDFDFLGNIRHILEACVLLQEAGICHYDLKELNIVVDFHGTLRIIDFGSAFIGDAVNEKNIYSHQYAFIPEYILQPPEFSVQGGLYVGETLKYSIEKTVEKKYAFTLMENMFATSKEEFQKEMTEFWAKQEVWKGDSWVPFFHEFWRKYDSWGVGTIFLRLLKMCLLHRKFVEDVWKPNRVAIHTVLKGLLEVNPYNRITCADALSILSSF